MFGSFEGYADGRVGVSTLEMKPWMALTAYASNAGSRLEIRAGRGLYDLNIYMLVDSCQCICFLNNNAQYVGEDLADLSFDTMIGEVTLRILTPYTEFRTFSNDMVLISLYCV